MEETVICLEPWNKFKPDLQALSPRHWQEVALNQDRIKLNVDWAFYDSLDDLGMLQCVAIRTPDDSCIGYHVGFVLENPHYKGYKMGQTDIFYLCPEHRSGLLGLKLFMEVEKHFRAAGCVKMITTTKLRRDVSTLFERLGCDLVDKTYTKELL